MVCLSAFYYHNDIPESGYFIKKRGACRGMVLASAQLGWGKPSWQIDHQMKVHGGGRDPIINRKPTDSETAGRLRLLQQLDL